MKETENNEDVHLVQIEDAKIQLADLIERGLKMPLQASESLVMQHKVIRALFPNMPSDLRRSGYSVSKEEFIQAGLEPYLCGQVTLGGAIVKVDFPVTLTLKLRTSPQFFDKPRRLTEVLLVKFFKSYD